MQAKVLAILTPGSTFVDSTAAAVAASKDAEGQAPVGLVLDTTSFYAESGGQVGAACLVPPTATWVLLYEIVCKAGGCGDGGDGGGASLPGEGGTYPKLG